MEREREREIETERNRERERDRERERGTNEGGTNNINSNCCLHTLWMEHRARLLAAP
jgi:hypothetical protein